MMRRREQCAKGKPRRAPRERVCERWMESIGALALGRDDERDDGGVGVK